MRVEDVDEVGRWGKCWLLNNNVNLQHNENVSAV
jgi:hypothetical protein